MFIYYIEIIIAMRGVGEKMRVEDLLQLSVNLITHTHSKLVKLYCESVSGVIVALSDCIGVIGVFF